MTVHDPAAGSFSKDRLIAFAHCRKPPRERCHEEACDWSGRGFAYRDIRMGTESSQAVHPAAAAKSGDTRPAQSKAGLANLFAHRGTPGRDLQRANSRT